MKVLVRIGKPRKRRAGTTYFPMYARDVTLTDGNPVYPLTVSPTEHPMDSIAHDSSPLYVPGIPAPAARWAGYPKFNFVGGHNAPEGMPAEQLARAATTVLARDAHLLATYNLQSGPQGFYPLREFVASKLARYSAMQVSADDILITSGSLQGLDLVNQLFVTEGDTVLVEEHSYGGALSRLRARGAKLVGVPLDDEGIRADALARALDDLKRAGTRPKFLYTIPTVQNPTSAIMGRERRIEILKLADEHDLLIFEDECYADLIWSVQRPPALHAIDTSDRVIHVGSFSKSIAPALRVGYLTAPWPILGRILAVKNDAGSGALEQMVLAEFCTAHFDAHVAGLNSRLQAKAEALADALSHHFGAAAKFTRPAGGIFLWVRFPEAIDTTALLPATTEQGVVYNPGPEWSTNEGATRSSMRLCFANPDIPVLQAGIATLADVFADRTGIPARDADVAAPPRA